VVTSLTTSNAEIARKTNAPCGFRRRRGICRVGAPRRCRASDATHRLRRAALHLPLRRSERGLLYFYHGLLAGAIAGICT